MSTNFFPEALDYCCPEHIAMRIMNTIAKPYFEDSRKALLEKRDELFRPYRSSHLITLHRLTLSVSTGQVDDAVLAKRVFNYVL